MNDAIAILIVIGFFALAAAYVGWCERIIATDADERLRPDRIDVEASPDRAAAETAALSGSRS